MTVDQAAQTIWNYMLMNQPLKKCDAIFALGSRDERVASYAADLYLQGYGDWLIFSGGVAHANDLLRTTWKSKTEAEHFKDIAVKAGVPENRIIAENKATNTGENILFTYDLLKQMNINLDSIILVQKPYMERRTYATFKKQWPNPSTLFSVTSQPTSYDDYFDTQNPKEDILHIMVGDFQRIKEYPAKGFQIRQEIPNETESAYDFLVQAGYTKHMIQTSQYTKHIARTHP
jgi:uncharacterized SAM-binding protein YcdF (DUF218 family)